MEIPWGISDLTAISKGLPHFIRVALHRKDRHFYVQEELVLPK